MERRLEELVEDGLLRPRTSRSRPEWIAPSPDHREPAPPEGYVVSFICFHERWFGVPRPSLCARSSTTTGWSYTISPQMPLHAIFAAVCEGYLGMEP
jgi:hypothetical protein